MAIQALHVQGAVLGIAVLAGATLVGCVGTTGTTVITARPSDPQAACTALQGMRIAASAIGKPSSGALVQSAVFIAADATDNANGEFCAVKGIVQPVSAAAPSLEFQVNLPTQWNRRALQMGGGGYDGALVTGLGAYTAQPNGTPTALRQGYVTLGSDGGHKGTGNFDGTFALNEEALLNYGQQSVKKTHEPRSPSFGNATAARPGASISSAVRRAGTRRSTRPRATAPTTTASSPTTRPTTSRCCSWPRCMWARCSTATAARAG